MALAKPDEGFLDAVDSAPASDPAPEPAAAEAAPEPDKPQQQKTDPANSPARPDGYVPRQALDEARNETRAERQARAAAEDRFAKMVERFYADNQPKEEPQGPPEWIQDPAAAHEYWAKRVEALEGKIGQTEQQTQQERHAAAVMQESVIDAQRYMQEVPAAQSALTHLAEFGRQHLISQGITDPAQISESLNRWQVQLSMQAKQMGIRPARLLHTMAEERGWKPAEKPAGVATGADSTQPNGNGAEQPRDASGRFTAEAERNERIARSQEQNASLSQAPGAPVKKMTPQELAKMPEEEMWRHFESVTRSKGSKQFNRDMGFA